MDVRSERLEVGINDGGWRSESGEKMDICYLKAKSKPCKLAVSR
jgi:hypothetical protein